MWTAGRPYRLDRAVKNRATVAAVDFELPRRRRPAPRSRCATWLAAQPDADRPPAGRGRLRRAALAEAVGPRRRPDPPDHHRRGAAAGRRAPAVEHDRHRLGRAHDRARRHRGAEGALPVPAARRRGDLVPALQRAGLGLRPAPTSAPGRCATATSGSSTARRSGRRWPSTRKFGILIARTDPDAPKHEGISYFICPMDTPGHRDPPDHRDDRRAHVQRGVLHRRAHPGREPRRRGEPRAGAWPRSRSATSGCRCRPAARCGAWARPPTTCSTLVRAAGGIDRPGAAPAPRRAAHRARAAAPHPPAHGHGAHQGRAARAPRRRSARSSPTSTARRSWAWPRTWPAPAACSPATGPARCPAACGTTASCSRPPSPSAAAPARCSATSSPSGCSACPHDVDVEQGQTWAESRRAG